MVAAAGSGGASERPPSAVRNSVGTEGAAGTGDWALVDAGGVCCGSLADATAAALGDPANDAGAGIWDEPTADPEECTAEDAGC
jgi:hypothetical protein